MSGRPPKLSLAPDGVYQLGRDPETTSDRVKRRQFEARMLAREHIAELQRAIEAAEGLAKTVAEGGDIYPPGVRDATGRVLSQLESQRQTLQLLMERAPEPEL